MPMTATQTCDIIQACSAHVAFEMVLRRVARLAVTRTGTADQDPPPNLVAVPCFDTQNKKIRLGSPCYRLDQQT